MSEQPPAPSLHSVSGMTTTCAALTNAGKRCRALPLPGEPFCIFHSQQAEAKRIMADARRAGGLARLASLKPTGLVVKLDSAAECKETARQALQLLMDGRLDRPRCDSLVNGCTRLLEAFALGELQAQVAELRAELEAVKEMGDAEQG